MLQAGGCCVPLDPGFPADRLSIYLEDSESLALITEPAQAQLAMSLVAGLPLSPQVGRNYQGHHAYQHQHQQHCDCIAPNRTLEPAD
jgi:non-ribosomal peptide synthetase component F